MTVVLTLSASAMALPPSSPIWLSVNIAMRYWWWLIDCVRNENDIIYFLNLHINENLNFYYLRNIFQFKTIEKIAKFESKKLFKLNIFYCACACVCMCVCVCVKELLIAILIFFWILNGMFDACDRSISFHFKNVKIIYFISVNIGMVRGDKCECVSDGFGLHSK